MYRILIFLLLLFASCSGAQKNRMIQKYSISATKRIVPKEQFNAVCHILLSEKDSTLITTELVGDAILRKISLSDGTVTNLARRGRGTKEYINLDIADIDTAGNFYCTEYNDVIKFSADGKVMHNTQTNIRLFNCVKIGGNFISYGNLSATTNTMYSLIQGADGKEINFGEFPDDGNRLESKFKVMAYQGGLIKNEALSRFAFLSLSGKFLDIYEIDEPNTPKPIFRLAEDLPEYEAQEGGVIGVAHKNPKFAYLSAAASKKYIYALYSGKSMKEHTASAFYAARRSNTIHVLDWDGNHLYDLELDREVIQFRVSNDDKYIIAIHEDEEGEAGLCRFDLPEIEL